MFSSKDTTCSSCDYKEPAGSAHFVTFIAEALNRFLKNLGVQKIAVGNVETDDFLSVLDAKSILPALLVNAKLNTKSIGSEFNSIPLTTVDDHEAFYKRRVVTTSSAIRNPSIAISALAETLYSTHQLTIELSKSNSKSLIDLNLLSPVSAAHEQSILAFALNESALSSAPINTKDGMTL
ncbi:hypothetical protein ACTXI5_08545 [Pseudoalteromonas nigrifaciens]